MTLISLCVLGLGSSTPVFARSWWSRACGRLLRERPREVPPALRAELDALEDEVSRVNRFSNRHLTAGIEFVEDASWAVVVRPRARKDMMMYASTPGSWLAHVPARALPAFLAEADEVRRRNPEMLFEVRSHANGNEVVIWLEGEMIPERRTRTMLVMLQHALEVTPNTSPPKT